MSHPVIQVENLSKLYRLGEIGTGTISHDLQRWLAKVRGKEDPYAKIGVENDRTKVDDSGYAWALQDVSFDVKQGDTLGIIGKNGAGKSTLLKLLSKVTSPTQGSIKYKGRIASLLEVGTGFHPELTGRENIFLNGAILGMTKSEIRRKFDEIVDFAGVQKYIDTPVKRYSSGMYVRLAFAVAAHLEPEILIVDEVLAVGDAEFQKKCLGKMENVAGEGRTVLFVSHNMQAVQSLCKTVLFLKAGKRIDYGDTASVINHYLNREVTGNIKQQWLDGNGPEKNGIKLLKAEVAAINKTEEEGITVEDALNFTFEFLNDGSSFDLNLSFVLYTISGNCIFNVGSEPMSVAKGRYKSVLHVPANFLNDDVYTVSLYFIKDGSASIFHINELLTFEVHDKLRDTAWYGKWIGAVRPTLPFSLNEITS